MPSTSWYVNRLRAMTPGEVTWRAFVTLRDALERRRFDRNGRSQDRRSSSQADGNRPISPVSLCDVSPGSWLSASANAVERRWASELVRRADRIAENHLSYFTLADRFLGDPIDWNADHESGRAAPLGLAPAIDYRDWQVTGDARVVWEPNRHQHLVVLGRAYRATGDERYASAAVRQLASWLDQCPRGSGMNWRSPLELAIRTINWIWTLDLIRPSGLPNGQLRAQVLQGIQQHVAEIARNYSRGSSANNHLIGEAAGVFISTACCPWLDRSDARRRQSQAILAREIIAQTYADGCSREQAFGYHFFALQFLLLAGVVARTTGIDFAPEYWARLEKMIEFAAAMCEAGPLPMVGDGDDGYVIDFDGAPTKPYGLFAVAAALFQRADFERAAAGDTGEAARWLLGRAVSAEYHAVAATCEARDLSARAFRESGYYLLQCGRAGSPEAISVLFDCGELGFGSLAAHGHADALSVTIRALGGDILIDPGTYDYFTSPAWREYFRSTRAHNTLMVDGADQSVALGPFMWGRRARAHCLHWEPSASVMRVQAEHDGYTRLERPVVHRRTVELDSTLALVTILDDVSASGSHMVSLFFHLCEECDRVTRDANALVISVRGHNAVLELDPRLELRVLRGESDPIGGWVSRGYHQKTPSWSVVASARTEGSTRFVTRLRLQPLPRQS